MAGGHFFELGQQCAGRLDLRLVSGLLGREPGSLECLRTQCDIRIMALHRIERPLGTRGVFLGQPVWPPPTEESEGRGREHSGGEGDQ